MSTVFTPFNINDDIVVGVPNRITYAMWSNSVGILTSFYTASNIAAPAIDNNSKYYYDIYGSADTGSAQVEFSITYGHYAGSGSDSSDREVPTKAIYGQYRNLLLDNPRGYFEMDSGSTQMLDFVAISIKRANIKQKLDAGNWELHITSASTTLKLIDDSGDSEDTNITNIPRAVAVVSGTIANGALASSPEYGIAYPEYGIILLHPTSISGSLPLYSASTYDATTDAYNDNAGGFFDLISGSQYFAARSEELISSTHYFVRVRNKEYNYSTNPTFYSASDGSIINTDFPDNPKAFITAVGLYDEDNELLAVGKVSQPIQKGFDREALLKMRLDF